MSQIAPENQNRILEFLKKVAPYSIVETGMRYAGEGHVSECFQAGSRIYGIVRDDDDACFKVELNVISGRGVEAQCACSTAEDMREQWCPHAVAHLWRAAQLGFFEPHSGFAQSEAVYRMNTSSPADIAAVLRELKGTHIKSSPETSFRPEVTILLDLSSDRLGLRVLFDGDPQGPTLFDGFKRLSSRAIDNILVRILDENGNWDERGGIWYINSSEHIETVVGLIQEYPRIMLLDSLKSISFGHELLEAHLQVHWQKTGADLLMSWILPDGRRIARDRELIGTGPYWTLAENTLYRLSPLAARLAALLPYSASLSISRSNVGPVLEALEELDGSTDFVTVDNPELQPESRIRPPQVQVEVMRRDSHLEHFASQEQFEIEAHLDFSYPVPPAGENSVYLPDRQKEKECLEFMESLGFVAQAGRGQFLICGEGALDFARRGNDVFPPRWKVEGMDRILKGMRFVDLTVRVSLAGARDSAGDRRKRMSGDAFDCMISLVQNNANIPISTLFKNSRSGSERWIRMDNGAYARVPGGGLRQLKATLGMLDADFRLSNTIRARLNMAQAISFMRAANESFVVNADNRLEGVARRLRDFSAIEPVKSSPGFSGKLRSYQLEGLGWLLFLQDFGLNGILADEMGLGKTVQALALLQYLKDSRKKDRRLDKPALIIAPTSVIMNWVYEARRFTPRLKVLLLHGPDRKRSFDEIDQHDLVITSYALIRLDRQIFEQKEFSYLIVDEAQNIKNPQAAVTKAVKEVRARNRLALTGTPTENRPLELWSIMDFLMPGYLGSIEFFRNYIEKPLLEGGPQAQIAGILNARTRPFLLRRTKAAVEKDLPPKVESVQHVEMTPTQAAIYSEILEDVRPKVFAAVKARGIRGASVSILAALLRLRQVCNHPASIEAFKGIPDLESGKFNLLKDLVTEALESGRKILLFSQFIEMLAIIRRWLDESAVNYLYLDGRTKERQPLIDQFNSDEAVRLFLISLKAGGTGLNLASADTVIIYDPWWNPAVEHQAVDRAHRIGQTRAVSVYRLVTEHSIEQKIMDLKSRKSKLVDALISDNAVSPLNLNKTDLENLFSPLPL